MFLSVAFMAGLFLFPLWRITLEAAQFPGGLKLNIWIDRFSGEEGEGDIIANINILNHYIGMQKIEPDSIPELKYFPKVVMAMMALGLIAAFLNRPWGYMLWLIIAIVLSALAVYDFYLWLYDYGHNLDPKAPIQVPGASFMPPLFGEKDLLNFYVKSYPQLGAAFLGASIVASFIAYRLSPKRKSKA